jgi:PAS domain S-box-containing protein
LSQAPTKDEAIARLESYQERLEAALKEGRAAYDRLFDEAPPEVGLHEIDLAKNVTRVNARELEMLGYRKDQVVGQHCSKFVVMHEASDRAATKKLSGEGLKPFVRAFLRADGSSVTMALVERYLYDAKGVIVGIRTALMPIEI